MTASRRTFGLLSAREALCLEIDLGLCAQGKVATDKCLETIGRRTNIGITSRMRPAAALKIDVLHHRQCLKAAGKCRLECHGSRIVRALLPRGDRVRQSVDTSVPRAVLRRKASVEQDVLTRLRNAL